MPRFDLSKYATVAERLVTLGEMYPDYRIETLDYSTEADRAKGVWRVKATLYLSREDMLDGVAKATGHAFEIDGQVNKDNPTSLASREEMEKVARGPVKAEPVAVPDGFLERVEASLSKDGLHSLWNEAVKNGFADQVKQVVADKKVVLS